MPFLQQIWREQKCLTRVTNIPRVRKFGEKRRLSPVIHNNIFLQHLNMNMNLQCMNEFWRFLLPPQATQWELRYYLHLNDNTQLLWVLGPPPLVEDTLTGCFWFESHELNCSTLSNTSPIQSHPELPPQTACQPLFISHFNYLSTQQRKPLDGKYKCCKPLPSM